jgi:hypothetical protein
MMEPDDDLRRWSALFCLPFIAALGIIFVGGRFLVAPRAAAAAFGIPLGDGNGVAFAYMKGIRDIFSGLVVFPFLFAGRRRPVAWIMLIATIIPITDGFILLKFSGLQPMFLAIHWGTALYMAVLALLLFRAAFLRARQSWNDGPAQNRRD